MFQGGERGRGGNVTRVYPCMSSLLLLVLLLVKVNMSDAEAQQHLIPSDT